MVVPALTLRDFAGSEAWLLETKEQARRAIHALKSHPCRYKELDFSGIAGVSWEFAHEFMALAQQELPSMWLMPRHYDRKSSNLITPLLARLARMREDEWMKNCERFISHSSPFKSPQ